MDERLLTRLRGAGMTDELISSLQGGDAAFALSEQTLAFVDAAGARQVALRDINRIHSDREGVLRVDTAGGTAITASLLGFEPAGVQGFFNEVRTATNAAKQLPQTPHTLPTAQGPWKSGWSTAPANTPPASTAPATPASPAPDPAPQASPPAAQEPPREQTAPPEVEESVTVLPRNPEPAPPPATDPAAKTPAGKGAAKPLVISTAPRYTPEPEAPRPAQGKGSKPAAEPRKPPQPTGKPAPQKTEATPVPVPRETPRVQTPARLNALLGLADSVERLTGTLRLLALAMGVAAILIGILRFREGDTVTGLWILGSGVIAAFALLVFAQVARLLVLLARQLNPDA